MIDLIIFGLGFGGIVFMIWFFWILPLRTWSHPKWFYIAEAERKYKKERLVIWLPLWVCVAMLGSGVGLIIEEWYRMARFGIDGMALLFTSVPLLMLVPIALCSRWISGRVKEKFHEVLLSPHCIACGYNLRGNPDATTCPECGVAIPWIKSERSIATDPTQDPAHPDRS